MTRREKILATTLLVVLVVIGGGMLFHIFVFEPISTVRAKLATAHEALQTKQGELIQERRTVDQSYHVNPRLKQWQKISLPPRDPAGKKPGVSPQEQKHRHVAQMKVEYEKWLSDLLASNGFQRSSIKIEDRPPDQHAKLK